MRPRLRIARITLNSNLFEFARSIVLNIDLVLNIPTSAKMEMLLISEVQKRSVLWNQRQKDRKSAENEWDEVANICGTSKEHAKKKWRGLRDQFCKELKKIPKIKASATQDLAAIYPGKWQYFKGLLFLKDVIIPIEADDNSSVVLEDSTAATETDDEVLITEVDAKNTTETEVDIELTNAETNYTHHSFVEASLSPKPAPVRRKRKKILEDRNDVKLKLLDIESKKLALLEASEDENSLFLRSLIPFMRALDPIRQLRVRTKFQDILLQETEAAENQQMYASFSEIPVRPNNYSEATTAFTVVELKETPYPIADGHFKRNKKALAKS